MLKSTAGVDSLCPVLMILSVKKALTLRRVMTLRIIYTDAPSSQCHATQKRRLGHYLREMQDMKMICKIALV